MNIGKVHIQNVNQMYRNSCEGGKMKLGVGRRHTRHGKWSCAQNVQAYHEYISKNIVRDQVAIPCGMSAYLLFLAEEVFD